MLFDIVNFLLRRCSSVWLELESPKLCMHGFESYLRRQTAPMGKLEKSSRLDREVV